MELPFKIAKHYWLEGKNAKWSISDSFDQNIVTWLKSEYSKLEEAQPDYKGFSNRTVFLFYTNTQDVYGRKITEIMAVLVDASFTSIEHIRALIASKLAHLSPSILDFTLVVEKSYVIDVLKVRQVKTKESSKSKFIKASILFLSFIFIMAIATFFIFSEPENNEQISSDKTTTRTEASTYTPPEEDIKASEDAPETEKSGVRDKFCEKIRNAESLKNIKGNDEKCFSTYIKDQCSICSDGKSYENNRKSYEDWIQKNKSECEPVTDPNKDEDLKEWKKSHRPRINKNLIKNFFSGEK